MVSQAKKRTVDYSGLKVLATKPRAKVARALAELGIRVMPMLEDEGNMERFVISKRLAVDRWTGNGFVNGIMEKTLFTSAIFLREHFRLPIMIVEGDVNYEYRGFDPQAVRGALSSMMLEYGITVLSTPDTEETVALLAMMIRQEQLGIPEISLIPKRKASDLPDMQRRLIEMLPGCGRVMARELLQHFGSVERIVQASADELQTVRGIGAKKAKEMHRTLTAEYEAVDTEKQVEDAVEVDPSIIFDKTVVLIGRQHHIYDDENERHVVDLVFRDRKAKEVILVELKRGRLEPAHREQLRRYIDHAHESKLIRKHLDAGDSVRGILASPETGELKVRYDDITVQQLDSRRIIKILYRLRRERLGLSGVTAGVQRRRSHQ